jgi:hypothetical protein
MTRRVSKTVPRAEHDATERDRMALLHVLTDVTNGVPPAAVVECVTDGEPQTLTLYRATGAIGGLVLITTQTTTHRWIDVQPLDDLAARHHEARRHSDRTAGRDAALAALLRARDRAFEAQRATWAGSASRTTTITNARRQDPARAHDDRTPLLHRNEDR